MKIPKGYLLREGDKVTVPAVVRFNQDFEFDTHIHLTVCGYSQVRIEIENITSLDSRSWEVGDKVCSSRSRAHGVVLAVDGDSVWVKSPNGAHWTCLSLWLEPDVDAAPVDLPVPPPMPPHL